MPQHIITDATSECPQGINGVHLMEWQEGSLYSCRFCGVFRTHDRKTKEWE